MIKRIFAFVALAAVALCGASAIRPAGADFAQQGSYGGVSTGTANAQVISLPGVAVMSQLRGVTISFTVGAGLTNTGPVTAGINAISPVAVDRMNSGTLLPLGGAEMPAGKMAEAFYDGAEFVLRTDYTGGENVGVSKVINYSTPDPGYVLEDGQCLSETAEPALFAKYGTQYNAGAPTACGTGQFAVDDKRGATIAAADSMGGTAKGRLTLCASTIGTICGVQSSVVAQANLASFTMFGSGSGSGSVSGTASGSMGVSIGWPGGNLYVSPAQSGLAGGSGTGPAFCQGNCPNLAGVGGTASGTLGVSGSAAVSTNDSIASGGSGTALTNVQPTKIVYYEAKL